MKRPKLTDPDYSTRIWEYIEFKNRQTRVLSCVSAVISVIAMALVAIIS